MYILNSLNSSSIPHDPQMYGSLECRRGFPQRFLDFSFFHRSYTQMHTVKLLEEKESY